MKRTNQGGSVLSFIIIGVILAVLLVGSVAMLRHRQSQPSSTTPAVEAPTTSPAQNKPTTTPSDGSSSDSTQSQSPSTPESSSAQSGSNAGDQAAVVELPQTGSAQAISTLFVLALLAGTGAAYVQSRRQRTSL